MPYMPYRRLTPEVLPKWRQVLQEQGRTMTWLSVATDTSYPVISKYSRERQAPAAWLEKVSDLLGVDVR